MLQNVKNSFFVEQFRWLLVNWEMEKVKKSKLIKQRKYPEAATRDAL